MRAGLLAEVVIAGVIACCGSWVGAQIPPAQRPTFQGLGVDTVETAPAPTTENRLPSEPNLMAPVAPDSYVIGKDDLLAVYVYQMPELTRQVRVDGSGDIALPLLGRPIRAAGLTSPELARGIASELSYERIAHNPQVQVMVRQVMSRPIVVSGAVAMPMVIQAARPLRLLEVLARAGGLTNVAGTTVLITLNGESKPAETIPLASLLDGADLQSDPLLTGGETVQVLTAQKVFAVGALKQPGGFPVTAGQPPTALGVLALAQGVSTTKPADLKHSQILRTLPGGKKEILRVNLDQVLKHKEPDPTLQAGDILYVPENGRAAFFDTLFQDVGQVGVLAFGYGIHIH